MGIELLGIVVVVAVVFALSFVTMALIARGIGGITIGSSAEAGKEASTSPRVDVPVPSAVDP